MAAPILSPARSASARSRSSFCAEELGFAVPIGAIAVTECQMVNQFKGSATEPPQFTRGYGLVFGQSERKAMSMALVDRALARARTRRGSRSRRRRTRNSCCRIRDNVQATGFVEHLKLPHYVDFQAELGLVRQLRAEFAAADGDVDKAVQEAAE